MLMQTLEKGLRGWEKPANTEAQNWLLLNRLKVDLHSKEVW